MNPRTRSRLFALICAVALTAMAVLLVIITSRLTRRVDVTATRVHELAPRTTQLLSALDRNATLAIAADLSQMEPAARQGLLDVLDKLQRSGTTSSPRATFTTRLMNTGTQAGLAEFDALMIDLAKSEKPAIDARTAELATLADTADELAKNTLGVAQLLDGARDDILASFNKQAQAQWDALAATLRTTQQDLARAAKSSREKMATTTGPLPVPPIDEARSTLAAASGAISATLTQAATLCDQVLKTQQANTALREKLAPVLVQLPPLRDRAGRLATGLAQLPVPRVLLVARAVERSRAALIVADPRTPGAPLDVVAIEPASLLEASPQTGDLRSRAEDVIAGAIANLNSTIRPRVVFVHDYAGKLALVDWQPFTLAVKRLSARGIDSAEWAVTVDRDLPADLARADPLRPTVFIALPGFARVGRDPRAQAASLPLYLNALKTIVDSGRPVLLSLEPSTVPSVGSPDPIIECLKPLGITPDTGRVLLEESKLGTRRVVSPYFDLVRPFGDIATPDSASPIAGTLSGLRLRTGFPVVIPTATLAPGVTARPIIAVPSSEARWLENEWSEFSRAVAQLRGEYAGINNAPTFDLQGDARATPPGFVLAVSAERTTPAGTQRLVITGFNGWFLDAVTTQQAEVDGRIATLFAGNMQLLESSVHWLAGQDDQLIRTASASATPTIPPLSDRTLAALRWTLAGLLPGLVLVLGVLWRVWRG